jgi:hypothetical protein
MDDEIYNILMKERIQNAEDDGYVLKLHRMKPRKFGEYVLNVDKKKYVGCLFDPGDLIMVSYDKLHGVVSNQEALLAGDFYAKDYKYSRKCADFCFSSAFGLGGWIHGRDHDLYLALALAKRAGKDIQSFQKLPIEWKNSCGGGCGLLLEGLSVFREKVLFAMKYPHLRDFNLAYNVYLELGDSVKDERYDDAIRFRDELEEIVRR